MKNIYSGVTVDTFEGMPPSILLGGIKLLGLEFIEINKTVFTETDKFAAKLGKIKTGFHLPIISESGWDLSCPEHQPKIDRLITNLNINKERLNIQHVISHPYEPDHNVPKLQTSISFLVENLKRIELPIYLENTPCCSPDKFKEMYRDFGKELNGKLNGMCYDAPHLYITGYDLFDFYREMENEIGAIHLSDCEEKKDRHYTFGMGHLPIPKILQMIKNSSFNGYITLEIKPHSLQEIDSYINSYLTTLKYMNYAKYLKTHIRMFFLRPLIQKFIQ